MLSVRQEMVLAHAEIPGSKWRRGGLIRQNLGCSEWQYAAELGALIDTAEAQEAYPVLCRRLRDLRLARAEVRSARRAS